MHHSHHIKEFVIFSIVIVVLLGSAQLGNSIGFENIIGWLKIHQFFGALIYILYYILSIVIITLPVIPLWPVALFVYPFWIAYILSFTGLILGANINFLLARKLGRPFVLKMMGKKLFSEIEHFINLNNPKVFFLVRLFGSNYFDPISYIAGLSQMSFKSYFFITAFTCGVWLFGMLSLVDRLGGLNNMKSLISIMGIYGGFVLVGTILWELYHKHHKKHFAKK